MNINIDQTRLFRVPLLCLIAIVCIGQLTTLAVASSDGEEDELIISRNEHGNTGGLRLLARIYSEEESSEAKDIEIPVLSPPRFRLDLIIPFNKNRVIHTTKTTLKPKVVRRIKITRRSKRRR
jgi:hypothetical protein